MPSPADIENESLEAHVALCAQRYDQLEKRLSTIETKVGTLQQTIEKSHMSMVKVLVGTAGTVIAGVVSTVILIVTTLHSGAAVPH